MDVKKTRSEILDPRSAFKDRTCIIINPNAGNDETTRLRRKLGGAFAARGASFDLITTEYAGHATVVAREAARLGYRAVCVVGGDGTLAEAATGLADTSVPLALIPRGTGNQVARNFKIPLAFEHAVEVAIHGEPTEIDMGRIDGRSFALVAGAGFDAAVMAAATRELKERWGFAAYIYAAVKEGLAATPARFHIQADDRELEISAVSVMIANVGALFAGYLPLQLALTASPLSAWKDGLFDIIIIAPRTAPEWASVLWNAARLNFGGNNQVIHMQARTVTINADPPIAVQIDGDPAGLTPMTATVVPAGARILLPRS